MREAQTTMLSELKDCNLDHARCVLRVEIELSVHAGLGQTKRKLVDYRVKPNPRRSTLGNSYVKLFPRRSCLDAREAGVREVQTTMASELEDGNLEHAGCVLRVEVELSVRARLGQTKRILTDARVKLFPRRSNLLERPLCVKCRQ